VAVHSRLERANYVLAGIARLKEQAFHLYERFRPEVPADERRWGAKSVLDLAKIEALAKRR
jgi:hypothetical protein